MALPQSPTYGGVEPQPFSPTQAVAWGWRKFTQFLGPVMIAVAIYVVLTSLTTLPALALNFVAQSKPDDVTLMLIDGIGEFLLQTIGTIAGWILAGGAARAALDVADGRQYDFVNALRRVPIGKLIGVQLLIGVLVLIGTLSLVMLGVLAGVVLHAPLWLLIGFGALLVIPSVLTVALFTYFTRSVLVDDPTTRVHDAIRLSVDLVRANLAATVLLVLLNVLVVLAGFLACCIGVVVAYPVTYFATANAYRKFRSQPVAP